MIDLDAIPEGLKEGENWPLLTLDDHWVWLARDSEGGVVGILIAAPCHGLVFIWRLKMLETAPHWALGKLLRQFIRDLRSRKCLGYIACLDICSRPAEQALHRIAFRAGLVFSSTTTLIAGSVNAKHVGEQ